MQPRRLFFRSLLQKSCQLGYEVAGHQYIPLKCLRDLENKRLRAVVPVFSEERRWRITDASVDCWDESKGAWVTLRILDRIESQVLRMLMSAIPLGEIADRVAVPAGWSNDEAWTCVSQLFLYLAEAGFCHPSKLPEEMRGEW